MTSEKIRIKTFGTFEISYRGERFNNSQNWGRILVYIFELLVQARKNSVSREIIISTLWPEKDNPGNVLNYSMFRLRDSLKKIPFLKVLSLIVTNKNTYSLNPEYLYEIDCEIFEAYYDRLKILEDISCCIDEIEDMLSIYQGDLYDIELNSMTMRIGNYYRFIYQEYMSKACTYFLQVENYDKILAIASTGSQLHPYNEDAHYYYLKALIGKRFYDKALAYYDSTIILLEETYGQPVSDGMRALYASISSKGEHYAPITQVLTNLNRKLSIEQAFHCDYVVFEAMYKLNQRRVHREKVKFYLLMFNLRKDDHIQHFTKYRDRFKEIILDNLRSIDIFTEFKPGQFLALISCSDINGAHIASQRIISIFRRRAPSGIRVNYYVEELSGTKEIEDFQFNDN